MVLKEKEELTERLQHLRDNVKDVSNLGIFLNIFITQMDKNFIEIFREMKTNSEFDKCVYVCEFCHLHFER